MRLGAAAGAWCPSTLREDSKGVQPVRGCGSWSAASQAPATSPPEGASIAFACPAAPRLILRRGCGLSERPGSGNSSDGSTAAPLDPGQGPNEFPASVGSRAEGATVPADAVETHWSGQQHSTASFIPAHDVVLFGRFKLLRRLGRGGMGEVWEAFDLALQARVALKTISPELLGKQELVERMRHEVILARRVSHPNVCRLFEFFIGPLENGEQLALFTMELIEGESLGDRLEKHGPLEAAEALRILRDVAAGLEAIHSQGVVHRDLKPANIMLVGDRAVVMDFGIARFQGADWDATATGAVVGTPAYMAPEQLRGEHPTRLSDLYAFALVAEDLVCGSRNTERVRPIPPRWKSALARARAHVPSERFQSPTALVRALEQSTAGTRRSSRAGLALVIGVLLAGLLALGGRRVSSARTERRVAALVEEARQLNLRYEFPTAVRLLDQALALQPTSAAAHFYRAASLGGLGRMQDAQAERELALKYVAQVPRPMRLLIEATYWRAVGKTDRASELAKELYALEPDKAEHLNLWQMFLKPSERLALYEKIRVARSPLTALPYFHLTHAIRASEAGNENARMAALDRFDALATSPEYRFIQATAEQIRESHYFNQENWEEALRLLAHAEEIYQAGGDDYSYNRAGVIERRALVYLEKAEFDRAASAYEEALALYRHAKSTGALCLVLTHQADVFFAQGKLRDGMAALQRVNEFVPEVELREDTRGSCREYWIERAVYARMNGKLDDVRESLRVSEKLYPIAGTHGANIRFAEAMLLRDEDKTADGLEVLRSIPPIEATLVQAPLELLKGSFALELDQVALAKEALASLQAGSTTSKEIGVAASQLRALVALYSRSRSDLKRSLKEVQLIDVTALDAPEAKNVQMLLIRLEFGLGLAEAGNRRLREVASWANREGAQGVALELRLISLSNPRLDSHSKKRAAMELAADAQALGFRRLARLAQEL